MRINLEQRPTFSTERWPELVCLGESLVDVLPIDTYRSLAEGRAYRAAAGGAPANVAVGAARLGARSALIGKVGDDPFGRELYALLHDLGVDVRALSTAPQARTALALVDPDAAPDQRFVFYRQATADTLLEVRDLDLELLDNASIFHFGSVSLSVDPARSTTLSAARRAREHGAVVTFDPNVRLDVWRSPSFARAATAEAASLAHVVKLSCDEIELMCGTSDPRLAGERLIANGATLAVITLGADGCVYATHAATGMLASPSVEALDATGAGDAFMAGLLAGLLRSPGCLEALTGTGAAVEPEPVLRFACAVGALAVTRHGAIPALPSLAQVSAFLDQSTPKEGATPSASRTSLLSIDTFARE